MECICYTRPMRISAATPKETTSGVQHPYQAAKVVFPAPVYAAPVQTVPNKWSAYYGYRQGYDGYAYGATEDPSAFAYGAYAGYMQYPYQTVRVQDMAALSCFVLPLEYRKENYDLLAEPDVKLNAEANRERETGFYSTSPITDFHSKAKEKKRAEGGERDGIYVPCRMRKREDRLETGGKIKRTRRNRVKLVMPMGMFPMMSRLWTTQRRNS